METVLKKKKKRLWQDSVGTWRDENAPCVIQCELTEWVRGAPCCSEPKSAPQHDRAGRVFPLFRYVVTFYWEQRGSLTDRVQHKHTVLGSLVVAAVKQNEMGIRWRIVLWSVPACCSLAADDKNGQQMVIYHWAFGHGHVSWHSATGIDDDRWDEFEWRLGASDSKVKEGKKTSELNTMKSILTTTN